MTSPIKMQREKSPDPALGGEVQRSGRRRGLARFVHSLLQAKQALFGMIVLVVLALAALSAPLIAPHNPTQVNLADRLAPPAWFAEGSAAHPLGTDSLGRDSLSMLLYGARVSLLVGLSAVAIAFVLGLLVGLVTGYYAGWVDDVLMRLADIQLAFPSIVLYIAVMAVLGAGLVNIILVLGVSGWVASGRVVRGQVLAYREKEFVLAARATGAGDLAIMFRHILPNVIAPLIIIATLSVASTIISEASLSFLGLGVPPSIPTWGSMLTEGREYVRSAWWLAVFPGLAIMLTVLGINLVGDWLRDYLDPRLQMR